jgi:3-hydroxyisobutyrate dehydrogenase-like beta-hydroxyacid dehydrogenase
MQFCKFYAVDGEEKLGFSVANANKDLGYFNQMVADLGSESLIAQGTSTNLQAAVDAGLGQNDVPVIFDYFTKLAK